MLRAVIISLLFAFATPRADDAEPLAGAAIFSPATHDAVMLREFVKYHGAAKIENYFNERRRTAPSDFFERMQPHGPHRVAGVGGAHVSRFDALGPVLPCPPAIRTVFGRGDEEKRICGLPSDEATLSTIGGAAAPCVIVSAGSNNQWGFEAAVHARMPRCVIHTLDCTVKPRVPAALKGAVVPHEICLGSKDETQQTRRFMTWRTFAEHAGIKTAPTALKLDIEGFEWAILTSIAAEPQDTLPLSISLELHYVGKAPRNSKFVKTNRAHSPYEISAFMDFLYTRGGYSLVDRHDNPVCKHCSEIVIARV